METVESQETVYLGIKKRIAPGTFTVRGGLYYVQRLKERPGKGFCSDREMDLEWQCLGTIGACGGCRVRQPLSDISFKVMAGRSFIIS